MNLFLIMGALFGIMTLGFFLQLVKSWIVHMVCLWERRKMPKHERWTIDILRGK